jgi:hypothetical protein
VYHQHLGLPCVLLSQQPLVLLLRLLLQLLQLTLLL